MPLRAASALRNAGGTGARAARLLAILITSITVVPVAVRAQTAGENPPAQQTTPAPATPPAAPTPAPAASGNQLPTVEVIQKQAEPAPKAVGPKAAKAKTAKLPTAATTATAAASGTPSETQVQMSPVAGSEIPIDKVAGSVSTLPAADFERPSASLNVADTLLQRVPGITITDVQGGPYQPEVEFHGFAATSVNGTPQGLAVYQNGVRINELFGDTVNWDHQQSRLRPKCHRRRDQHHNEGWL
jgi:iron complex outermembrane recepter protein